VNKKDLVLVPVFAALYAVLVWVFQPISFMALQFRVAEALKPAVAKKWVLMFAFAIGNFLGNLVSPFAGIYELAFMPLMNVVGGLLAWKLSRGNYFVAGAVYSLIIALSVSYMLSQLFNIPFLILIFPLIATELIAMTLGATIFKTIEKRFKWY